MAALVGEELLMLPAQPHADGDAADAPPSTCDCLADWLLRIRSDPINDNYAMSDDEKSFLRQSPKFVAGHGLRLMGQHLLAVRHMV